MRQGCVEGWVKGVGGGVRVMAVSSRRRAGPATKKGAAVSRGAPFSSRGIRRLVGQRRLLAAVDDRNGTGLLLFRHFTLQLDRQQAVDELPAHLLPMIRELKPAFQLHTLIGLRGL